LLFPTLHLSFPLFVPHYFSNSPPPHPPSPPHTPATPRQHGPGSADQHAPVLQPLDFPSPLEHHISLPQSLLLLFPPAPLSLLNPPPLPRQHHGSTDQAVLINTLEFYGIPRHISEPQLPALCESMLEYCQEHAGDAADGIALLPGVRALLEELLSMQPRVVVGLVRVRFSVVVGLVRVRLSVVVGLVRVRFSAVVGLVRVRFSRTGVSAVQCGSGTGESAVQWGSGTGESAVQWGSGTGESAVQWGSGTGEGAVQWGSGTGESAVQWGSGTGESAAQCGDWNGECSLLLPWDRYCCPVVLTDKI
ncbi:unnamed protein product, partial [Closterium sp. NIES-54]